jgi:hypothetical protein
MNILLVIAITLASGGVFNTNLGDIARAISAGDAEALGRYFDETVEISIANRANIYRKPQAVAAVKNFFTDNKPRSFSQVHQGASPGNDSQYCIGNLSTDKGAFRVYIYIKQGPGGQALIQELRFDRE